MKYKKAITIAIVLLVGILALVIFKSDSGHTDCDGDDHAQLEEHDEHEEEHEEGHEDEDGHEEGLVIELSKEQIKELGIELATAISGKIDVYVNLPGEVAVNADRMAHIVPRVSGVVSEVKKKLGDAVKAGEVMAMIRSRDLADAKAGYLAAIERYDLAKTIFEREEKLWKEKISSEQDYLDAKKGFAEAKIEMRSVEQKLHAIGFSQEYLEKLPLEQESGLTKFEITAPFDGTVIDKHITLGELVSDDADVFVVADLSSVWVDLHVYPKDLVKVKKGQKVIISADQTIPDTEATISYVGPVVGAESRTALARVVLPNSTGVFRPGLFVTAKVTIDNVEAGVIVSKDAVQNLDGKKCVFTKDEHGFEPAFVNLGQSNAGFVQVTSGLYSGQQYVTKGAFELKAKIATSSIDSHAGHGH
ncbi:efflux RND transporter periplasmic adaptor subunit [Planctomycetota bacterium]